jgi:F-type H+-transporting ATPase subunit gamma
VLKRELHLVVAGDRGLCGGFNSNIARFLTQQVPPRPDLPAKFYCIGRRAILAVKKIYGADALARQPWTDVFDNISFALTNDIAKNLLSDYQRRDLSRRFDAVSIVYNTFASRMKQEVVKVPLMPLNLATLTAAAATATAPVASARLVYEILPSPEEALTELVEHYLSTQLFHAITESYAAELSARVNAMESATGAAQDMIDAMTLLYNRARQTGITNELIDIIGGANAL